MTIDFVSILADDFLVNTLEADDFVVVNLGPVGVIPPDAGFETVHLYAQYLIVDDGELNIDRRLGEYVQATINSSITSFAITGWPPTGWLGRIMLEIISTGDFDVTWPSSIKWSRDRPPEISASGNDLFLFTSVDGGSTIKASVIGQDFPTT